MSCTGSYMSHETRHLREDLKIVLDRDNNFRNSFVNLIFKVKFSNILLKTYRPLVLALSKCGMSVCAFKITGEMKKIWFNILISEQISFATQKYVDKCRILSEAYSKGRALGLTPPPWVGEIYGFQEVFGPHRVLEKSFKPHGFAPAFKFRNTIFIE